MVSNGQGSGVAPMRAADAFFWLAEAASPELRPLVAGLFALDRAPDHDRVRAAVTRMSMLMPRLRQRVVSPLFGFGMPAWEADPAFDLDYHLRTMVLAAPGTWPQLLRFAGEIFSAPLDHLRPLWEAHLIEGLEDGRAALLLKLHHAVMDGVGSLALFDVLTQENRRAPIAVPRRVRPGPPPRREAEGASRLLSAPGELLRGVGRIARGSVGVVAEFASGAPPPAWRSDGDGVGRRLDTRRISMVRMRRIKDALGVTLNDLVLAAVAGALGRYHARTGLPSAVSCMVPMSLRRDHERAQLGNRVGGFTVSLPVGEADPIARLQSVHAQTSHAKANGHGASSQLFMQAAALVPAPLFRAVAERIAGRVQSVCSNVPEPTRARYFAGARIDAVFPFAPVMRGTPLSIALLSYGDVYGIGIDTDPTVIPDPQRIGRALEREIDDLERRAGAKGRRTARRSARQAVAGPLERTLHGR